MDILQGVSTAAVWGSLLASVFLGAFLVVQAALDQKRREKFIAFALICATIATVDFFHSKFTVVQYEQLRVFLWSAQAGSLLWLFGYSVNRSLLTSLSLFSAASAVWLLGKPELATSVVVPGSYLVTAYAHGTQYFRSRGYASSVLWAVASSLAFMCFLYYPVMSTGDARIIGLGYIHYAFISMLGILFGWTHLPRELQGLAPVKVNHRAANIFVVMVILGELLVQLSLLPLFSWPPYLYLLGSLFQLTCIGTYYLYHRHQLVIYTANVADLLEQRTHSLRSAQEELAKLAEKQADQLDEQAEDLRAQQEVISRQRRLELAAQTAGQVAHDIQNIVSPVQIFLQKLLKEASDTTKVNENVAKIRNQINGLLELTGQFLALSRRGGTIRNTVSSTELLTDLKDMFPGKEIKFKCTSDASVHGSKKQLLRALANLISNALESGVASSSEVSVSIDNTIENDRKRCHLGFLRPGRYCRIVVTDKGSGIPLEIIDRIFEPFFTSKEGSQTSGSGLGLSTVAAVLDDHQGVLDLETGPSGTKFSVYMPISERTSPLQPVLCGNETVAVIDDDITVLKWIEDTLNPMGYKVRTFTSGNDAIRRLVTEQVDIVILDSMMVGLNGVQTLFALKHLHPSLISIVYSSFINNSLKIKYQELDVADFLVKPASPEELLFTIRQALDDRITQNSNITSQLKTSNFS